MLISSLLFFCFASLLYLLISPCLFPWIGFCLSLSLSLSLCFLFLASGVTYLQSKEPGRNRNAEVCVQETERSRGCWSVCLCIISWVQLIRSGSNTNLLTALSTKHSRWDTTHAHTHTHTDIIYKTPKQESCEPEIRKYTKLFFSLFDVT